MLATTRATLGVIAVIDPGFTAMTKTELGGLRVEMKQEFGV